MGKRENKVETYLDREVKSLGGTTRKWVSPGRDGVMDRIVFIQGLISFVEVKTLDGVLSSAQKREAEVLRGHGANVFTVYGCEGVDNYIRTLKEVIEHVDDTHSGSGERVLRGSE